MNDRGIDNSKETSESRGAWPARAAVIFTFAFHFIYLIAFFGGPGKILSSEPMLYDDHSWHFYYGVVGGNLLRDHLETWGYDPYMMAGYPTDVFDTSDRTIKLCMALAGSARPETAYKLIVFAMAFAAAPLFYLGAVFLGMRKESSAASALIGTWAWWAGGGAATFQVGLVGFGLAGAYAVFFAGLFNRFLLRISALNFIALTAAAALALFIHPGVAPIIVIPCGTLYIFRFRSLKPSSHAAIALSALLAVMANLLWILPQWMNLRFAFPSTSHLQNPAPLIAAIFADGLSGLQFIVWVLPFAAYSGARRFKIAQKSDLFHMTLWTFLGLFIICFFGSLLPVIDKTQPSRYGLPLLFFLCPAAAEGFMAWISQWRSSAGGFSFKARGAGLLIAGFSLIVFLASPLKLIILGGPKLVGMPESLAKVIRWAENNTDRSGRLLLEDRGPFNKLHGDTFPAAPIAYYSGREIIGGPHWMTHLLHHHADFSGATLFGKRFGEWDERSLSEAMDLYNVAWAGASTKGAKKLLEDFPGLFERSGEAGGVAFYKVKRETSFFLVGSGEAYTDFNRIVLKNVVPAKGRVVISYHWHPRLRAAPPSRLVRVMMGDDPVGFIGIEDPRRETVISLDYGWNE